MNGIFIELRVLEPKQHINPLVLILILLLMGKLAGETTLSGIAVWIKERKETLKKQR